jgi:hypothetical protein
MYDLTILRAHGGDGYPQPGNPHGYAGEHGAVQGQGGHQQPRQLQLQNRAPELQNMLDRLGGFGKPSTRGRVGIKVNRPAEPAPSRRVKGTAPTSPIRVVWALCELLRDSA